MYVPSPSRCLERCNLSNFLTHAVMMARSQYLFARVVFMVSFVMAMSRRITIGEEKNANIWFDAHATFYGDMSGRETMQGACGYGDLFKQGYGLYTAALSTALFSNGLCCGACFELMCVNDPQWCIPNAGTIKITATNFCPPNYDKPDGNWCNPPLKHFDLSMPMFTRLAPMRAGIVPVKYRRVGCKKIGGVKFEVKGNPYFLIVLLYNVGGAGDVANVKIKGSNTDWIQMSRIWGQNWVTGTVLVRESLSFQVTTSDNRMLQFNNVALADWQFGQNFDAKYNF